MQTTSKLAGQIAAAAGTKEEVAQVAAYLLDLSRAGKSLGDAALLLRKARCEVRDIARDWGISFTDYAPGDPIKLTWLKPARGEWVMKFKGSTVARIISDGKGWYCGSWERDDASITSVGSSAEVAARRLSKDIDRRSIALFGVDDIEIHFPLPDARAVLLAPVYAEHPHKLRSALAA